MVVGNCVITGCTRMLQVGKLNLEKRKEKGLNPTYSCSPNPTYHRRNVFNEEEKAKGASISMLLTEKTWKEKQNENHEK